MSKRASKEHNQPTVHQVDYRELSLMQQAIFDGSNYSIISTSLNGTINSFNKAASRLLGYSPDEVIGIYTPALFHDPEEIVKRAEILSKELGRVIRPGMEVFYAKARLGIAEELEWTYIHKDGSRTPILLSVTALRDGTGEINGFLGIAIDITERVLIKRAFREEEERYRLLFDRVGVCIFLMREDSIVDCNPATLELFRCTREQIINHTPSRFSPEYQSDGKLSKDKALEKVNAALSGETQFFEWQHLRMDGTLFYVEVTLNIIEIKGIPHVLATVRDISERKEAESRLEESRKQLVARNESLWLINKLSNRLQGSHSYQVIVDETLDALLGVTQTTHVAIYLIDAHESKLRLMACHGFDKATLEAGQELPLQGSLSGVGLEKGEIVFSDDISTDDRLEKKVQQALLAMGICSGVVVPLKYQGKKLGSINIVYKSPHSFSDSEKETLDVISNTVSLSLANARQIKDLEYMANHDPLTGLSNRSLFHYIFTEKISKPRYKSATLMLLDLDRFKEINDTLGHHVGDELLKQIGPRLERIYSDQDIAISRLGGDEFTLLIDGEADKKNAEVFVENLLAKIREPFLIDNMKLEIDASVGVAFYPHDGANSHALLRSADVAMYEAKQKGNNLAFYESSVDKNTPERLSLITELNNAIRSSQLLLHYQPKIDLENGSVSGLEALVRWQHKKMGLLYPDKFMQFAEVSDAIHHLTEAVLRMALEQQSQWYKAGYHLSVAVNLSARNLIDNRCITTLQRMLNHYNVEPGMLELEITETALMHDPETAIALLEEISRLGVKLSIDDFGTGYSSLSYLRRMPISAVKIDRGFVKDMLLNVEDEIIVSSIIALAHNLNLDVIAEGVEDNSTMQRLKLMGCDLVQGNHISKPKPWNEMEIWFAETDKQKC